jgi:hypothetical protein
MKLTVVRNYANRLPDDECGNKYPVPLKPVSATKIINVGPHPGITIGGDIDLPRHGARAYRPVMEQIVSELPLTFGGVPQSYNGVP